MGLRTRLLVGVAVLVAVAVASSGWLVLAVARTGGIAPARSLVAAIAVLDALVVALLGILILRRIVDRLDEIARAARRVAQGELNVPPLPVDGTDEIARLSDAFNEMVASLRLERGELVAQEKLVTVGRLAAGVAHEVGNPLAAVLGYADLLLHDEAHGDRREMLERIRKETERIRGIVADLLDYSRPAAEKPQPTRLADHVESAIALLRPHPRFRGVTVENQVSGDLPLASASTRLVQVLVNLFLNGADAMAGNGTITVSAKPLDGDAGLALFVRDRGPGVPEAEREKIFEPFFTTKQPGQGTGLGLAISRAIALAHGGDLLLARTDGPGATFVLRLPRWKD